MKKKSNYLKKSVLCIAILLESVMSSTAPAQEFFQRVEIPSSPNPVGSGARAISMGGAFIAVADDATAASWNPAGLTQLELPEISLVVNGLHRIEHNTFSEHPEASGAQTVSMTAVNYFSAAYPFTLRGYNMVVSMNYQTLYDLNRKWDFPIRSENLNQNFDYKQEGKLSTVGLAYGIQVTPNFSFGLTVNMWNDRLNNRWEHALIQQGTGVDQGQPLVFQSQTFDRFEFSGVNANFGVLWNAADKLTIGGVFKTPFHADILRSHRFTSKVHYPNQPQSDYEHSRSAVEDADLKMPMSFGIGVAYRLTDVFTISCDVYRTQWDDFVYKDSKGSERSFITGGNPSDVQAANQIRIGAEYLFIKPKYVTSICGGMFYDPAPADGNPDDIYGFSIGTGIGIKGININAAYQFRFGNDIGAFILKNLSFSQDLEEHSTYLSVVIHF